MAAPTFTLPTTGTNPRTATKENLENGINTISEELYGQITGLQYELIKQGLQALKQSNGPILIAATGQSNMIGSNVDSTGANDTDAGVFIWNSGTSAWQVSTQGVPAGPFTYNTAGTTYPNPQNLAHWLALRLRRETGREVYIVLDARGSTSITQWKSTWASEGNVRDMFGALSSRVTAALASTAMTTATKTAVDFVIFAQGEQDSGMTTATYRGHFYSAYDRFRNDVTWCGPNTPFLCVELPYNTIYATQNDLHSNHHRRGIVTLLTAPTDGLAVDSSGVHYTGEALQEIGYTRAFNALIGYLGNAPTFSKTDLYLSYPSGHVPLSQVPRGRPLDSADAVDLLVSSPAGLVIGSSAFSTQRGKIGWRTAMRATLAAGATVPTDMPGGHLRMGGNATLPTAISEGYTVTLSNNTAATVTLSAPASGTIVSRGGNVSSIRLLPSDSVTVGCYSADGLTWQVLVDGRMSEGYEATIANNAVFGLTPPANGGHVVLTVNPNANAPSATFQGMVWFNVGTTPSFIKSFGGSGLVVLASDLTGTTGTVGNLTVGGITGTLEFENRTGASIILKMQFVA